MPFDMKAWLDSNVVPAIQEKPLVIYSFLWNGNPPKEVLVFLKTQTKVCNRCHCPVGQPAKGIDCMQAGCDYQPQTTDWASSVKALIDDGWRFDYTREAMMTVVDGTNVPHFGSDGAPHFDPAGMARARVFRKTEDGVGLILELGCQFWPVDGMTPGLHAAEAVKNFFSLFEGVNPLEVCSKFGVVFGQA